MVPSRQQARTLARGLGWFSIGLGMVELLCARRLASAVGLPGRGGLVRACGLREIACGMGLLATRRRDPSPWLWGRVAGDAVDLALLSRRGDPGRSRLAAAAALATVGAATALDVACARRLTTPAAVPQADYTGRSGWPRPVADMRGAAREGAPLKEG
ncbi:MAG TPA: hypothetical protein VFL86_00640 [Burkholderiaceae bacterium]|nr:hypothetical protein [Burkholderiaceae bacterium]